MAENEGASATRRGLPPKSPQQVSKPLERTPSPSLQQEKHGSGSHPCQNRFKDKIAEAKDNSSLPGYLAVLVRIVQTGDEQDRGVAKYALAQNLSSATDYAKTVHDIIEAGDGNPTIKGILTTHFSDLLKNNEGVQKLNSLSTTCDEGTLKEAIKAVADTHNPLALDFVIAASGRCSHPVGAWQAPKLACAENIDRISQFVQEEAAKQAPELKQKILAAANKELNNNSLQLQPLIASPPTTQTELQTFTIQTPSVILNNPILQDSFASPSPQSFQIPNQIWQPDYVEIRRVHPVFSALVDHHSIQTNDYGYNAYFDLRLRFILEIAREENQKRKLTRPWFNGAADSALFSVTRSTIQSNSNIQGNKETIRLDGILTVLERRSGERETSALAGNTREVIETGAGWSFSNIWFRTKPECVEVRTDRIGNEENAGQTREPRKSRKPRTENSDAQLLQTPRPQKRKAHPKTSAAVIETRRSDLKNSKHIRIKHASRKAQPQYELEKKKISRRKQYTQTRNPNRLTATHVVRHNKKTKNNTPLLPKSEARKTEKSSRVLRAAEEQKTKFGKRKARSDTSIKPERKEERQVKSVKSKQIRQTQTKELLEKAKNRKSNHQSNFPRPIIKLQTNEVSLVSKNTKKTVIKEQKERETRRRKELLLYETQEKKRKAKKILLWLLMTKKKIQKKTASKSDSNRFAIVRP